MYFGTSFGEFDSPEEAAARLAEIGQTGDPDACVLCILEDKEIRRIAAEMIRRRDLNETTVVEGYEFRWMRTHPSRDSLWRGTPNQSEFPDQAWIFYKIREGAEYVFANFSWDYYQEETDRGLVTAVEQALASMGDAIRGSY